MKPGETTLLSRRLRAAVHAVGRDGLDRPARDADVAHSIEF